MSRVRGRVPFFVSSSVMARPTFLSAAKVVAVTALPIALAACAASHQHHTAQYAGAHAAPHAAPAHMPMPRKPAAPEYEADGLPVQAAPYRRETVEADDPTEPFSPNYGRPSVSGGPDREGPAANREERHANARAIPPSIGTPRIIRSRILSAREANAVMAQAIAEHERRNP